jgi:hypothetical protein
MILYGALKAGSSTAGASQASSSVASPFVAGSATQPHQQAVWVFAAAASCKPPALCLKNNTRCAHIMLQPQAHETSKGSTEDSTQA